MFRNWITAYKKLIFSWTLGGLAMRGVAWAVGWRWAASALAGELWVLCMDTDPPAHLLRRVFLTTQDKVVPLLFLLHPFALQDTTRRGRSCGEVSCLRFTGSSG